MMSEDRASMRPGPLPDKIHGRHRERLAIVYIRAPVVSAAITDLTPKPPYKGMLERTMSKRHIGVNTLHWHHKPQISIS